MSSLFAELKRRNVFRVAAAYAVASWLLTEVASVILPTFGAPEWVLKVLVSMLMLGFPLVVTFSWVYELTPEGVKREKEVGETTSITHQTGKRLDLMTMAMVVVGIGFLVYSKMDSDPVAAGDSVVAELASERVRAPSGADPGPVTSEGVKEAALESIAVLPFADMSAAGDQEYFTDGISEELLNLLARIEGLKVAARTSSFKFKGSEADIAEIGKTLNVATVLEGSVRKSGNQIRITAQLIKVDDGFHLWSQSYDRTLDNIFAVQDEIATAIVDALKLELDLAVQTAARTDNVEAFDLYLRGRQHGRNPSRDGLLQAIEYYNQAVAIDPGFARAYSGIADAYTWLEDYGGLTADEAFPIAQEAALRALELDPNLVEAHVSMGFLQIRYHTDSYAALESFEKALSINPNYDVIYAIYPGVVGDMGGYERQAELYRKGLELAPLSSFLKKQVAQSLSTIGQVEAGRKILDEMLVRDPEDTYALEELGTQLWNKGQLAESYLRYQSMHELRPGDPYAAAQLTEISIQMGDLERANFWIEQARARGPGNRWEVEAMKSLYRLTGENQKWFEMAEAPTSNSTMWNGWEALGIGQFEQARERMEALLAQRKYSKDRPLIAFHTRALIGLIYVDKQLNDSLNTVAIKQLRDFAALVDAQHVTLFRGVHIDEMRAQLAALEGDREQTLHFLQQAAATGYFEPGFLVHNPLYTPWQDDPEFLAIDAAMRDHGAAELTKLKN